MGCSPSKATVTPTTKPLPPISKSDEGKGRKSVNQRKSVIQKSGQQSIAYEIPVEGQGKKNTLPKIMSPEALKAKLVI